MNQMESVQDLKKYLNELGNHKLEKLEYDKNGYAIVRKSKKYAFGLSFEEVTKRGFRLSHMQSFSGKDEVIIFFVENKTEKIEPEK